jgi:hypothetical protein
LTPPSAPPVPANASPAIVPLRGTVPPVKAEQPKKPLEARFPRLYNTWESTLDTKSGKVEDVLVPKEVPPTLHDVVRAVCGAHGTSDTGLISDLTSSITEFLDD